MIDGCLDWRRNGVVACPAIDEASAEYFRGEDTFGQWLDEECELMPGSPYSEFSAALFESFREFLAKNSYDAAPWNATAFGRELSKHAVKGKDKKTNVVTWSGIRLTG